MHKSFLIIFFLLSIAGIAKASSKDFEYEIELNIYTTQQLREKGLLLQNAEKNMNYLYGWVRLKSFPENVWTIIPRCHVKAWSKSFNTSFFISGIGGEKSYILIPIGSTISDKNFKVKIK